jgi:polyisoprenoid-binding protein YceI
MKIIFLGVMLFGLIPPANAQKYLTRTGNIQFYSHSPLEDIKADNNQVASVIDLSTGEMVFQVLVKSFKFEKALMEEHFNENYMESDKYPRSTFKGKITDPSPAQLSKPGKYDVTVEGELDLHNVKKNITVKGTLETGPATVLANAVFNISPADYNIEIPAVVRDNIAKSIEVTVNMNYTPAETNK